jgi:hypothetical protein
VHRAGSTRRPDDRLTCRVRLHGHKQDRTVTSTRISGNRRERANLSEPRTAAMSPTARAVKPTTTIPPPVRLSSGSGSQHRAGRGGGRVGWLQISSWFERGRKLAGDDPPAGDRPWHESNPVAVLAGCPGMDSSALAAFDQFSSVCWGDFLG